MTMLQLNPPIWVDTPLGPGVAMLIIDYGIHTNTIWVVSLENKDWVMKHIDSNDIKIHRNWTFHFGSLTFNNDAPLTQKPK
jgi:hypothetical protein